MRTLDAVAVTAIAASAYRAGFIVEITLQDEGPGVRYWRWAAAASDQTYGGNTYTARPLVVGGAPNYGEAALCRITVSTPDVGDAIRTELRNDPSRLCRRRVRVFELISSDPAVAVVAIPWFDGSVESVTVGDGYASFQCGPLVTLWGLVVPDPVAGMCRYRSTAQCPYVASCLRSYAACTANSKTDIFGGWRFLPPTGTRVEFRDGGATLQGGDR